MNHNQPPVIGTIHIGDEIKKRIRDLGISQKSVSDRVHMSQQNLSGILKKSSIDCEQLVAFCRALDFDFFLLISERLFAGGIREKKKPAQPGVVLKVEGAQIDTELTQRMDRMEKLITKLIDQQIKDKKNPPGSTS